LQLYGGTVQDWTGNVVGGWAAPQAPGQPNRFETRMPMTANAGEQVYDWVEMTMADGNAFALARNVTLFVQPVDPQPSAEIPPQKSPEQEPMMAQDTASEMQNVVHAEDTHIVETAQAPAVEADMQEVVSQPDVTSAVPDFAGQVPDLRQEATEAIEDTAIDGSDEANTSHEPVVFAEYTPDPEVIAQAPETLAVPAAEVAPATETPAQPEVNTAVTSAVEVSDIPNEIDGDSDRAYERRALPIENESAVLGNNWRDAVIAKAVGVDAVPEAEAETAPSAPAASGDEQGPKRILLAEDNAINALLTRTLLEADGHVVETVEDGLLAVEAMKTSTYDLIFMDMRMPNMDGLEATRKIRTLSNVPKDLPIIALTANAFDDDRNACFDSGMNDFMTKPVSAEELSEMVTQWAGPKEERMAS